MQAKQGASGLTANLFVDNNQIVEGRGPVKLGPVLVRESPAPIFRPPSPKMPDEVGADISQLNCGLPWTQICCRLQFLVCFIYVTPSLIRRHARASK